MTTTAAAGGGSDANNDDDDDDDDERRRLPYLRPRPWTTRSTDEISKPSLEPKRKPKTSTSCVRRWRLNGRACGLLPQLASASQPWRCKPAGRRTCAAAQLLQWLRARGTVATAGRSCVAGVAVTTSQRRADETTTTTMPMRTMTRTTDDGDKVPHPGAQLQQPQKRLPQTGHRNRSKILAPRAAPRATQGTDDDQNDCKGPCCSRFADYQLTRRATCEVHFKDGSDRTSHLRLCQGALCHGRTWVHGASKHHCEKQCRRNEDFHSCCIRLRLRCFRT